MAKKTLIRNSLVQDAFGKYLVNSNYTSKTVSTYLSSMRTITRYLREDHIIDGDIYDLTRSGLKDAFDSLVENEDFVDKDSKSGYKYSHAFTHYCDFIDCMTDYLNDQYSLVY